MTKENKTEQQKAKRSPSLTPRELAKFAGITQQTLTKYLQREYSEAYIPSISTMQPYESAHDLLPELTATQASGTTQQLVSGYGLVHNVGQDIEVENLRKTVKTLQERVAILEEHTPQQPEETLSSEQEKEILGLIGELHLRIENSINTLEASEQKWAKQQLLIDELKTQIRETS